LNPISVDHLHRNRSGCDSFRPFSLGFQVQITGDEHVNDEYVDGQYNDQDYADSTSNRRLNFRIASQSEQVNCLANNTDGVQNLNNNLWDQQNRYFFLDAAHRHIESANRNQTADDEDSILSTKVDNGRYNRENQKTNKRNQTNDGEN